jgi:ABC-type transport system involved in Fe-S cluster assembly fused permease/ATPase subunit
MASVAAGHDGGALRALRANIWIAGVRGRLALLFAMTFVSASLAAAGPLFMRHLVDALGAHPLAVPLVLTIGYPLTRMTGLWIIQARVILMAWVMEGAKARYAAGALAHVLRLGRDFRLEQGAAGLARLIERGATGLEASIRSTQVALFQVGLEALFSGLVLARVIGPGFGLVVLAVMAGYAAVAIAFTRRQVKLRREVNVRDSASNRRLLDTLSNFDAVQAFDAAAHETARYAARATQAALAVRVQAANSLMNMAWQAIEATALAGVITLAAHEVLAHRMSVGTLVMIQVYLMQVFANMAGLGVVYADARQGFVDLGQLQTVLDRPPPIADAPRARPLIAPRGEVTFEHVSFAYDAARPILADVSFTVPAGRSLAIVGATGAGKTTIGHLLLRLHEPDAGVIRIDGVNLRDVTLASLRATVGFVPQDTQLFDDTLGYNIRYGRPDASEAEVADAARHAQLADFIAALPAGYHTLIGERGLKLSGGERQRIAIARLALKRPRVFLFDEATAALDSITERAVQRALAEVAAGHTRLIIAHRLSTVVDADEILVLAGGHVVERGDHASLLVLGGRYAALWAQQAANPG